MPSADVMKIMRIVAHIIAIGLFGLVLNSIVFANVPEGAGRLYKTNLHRPRIPAAVVTRPWLLQHLNEVFHPKNKLTIISAPAGSGTIYDCERICFCPMWMESLLLFPQKAAIQLHVQIQNFRQEQQLLTVKNIKSNLGLDSFSWEPLVSRFLVQKTVLVVVPFSSIWVI